MEKFFYVTVQATIERTYRVLAANEDAAKQMFKDGRIGYPIGEVEVCGEEITQVEMKTE